MKVHLLTRAQKIFSLVTFLVVALLVIFWLARHREPVVSDSSAGELAVKFTPSLEKNTNSIKLENNVVTAATFNTHYAKPSILAAPIAQKKSTWVMGNAQSATPSIVLNEKIVAYEAVEINSQPETFPQVGEQIVLPMLKGTEVKVDVQSITKNPNGDQTWSGHLQGHGTDYPVIMTYGEHSVFAMITTPEGSYSMESVDGIGWLYKNPSELELSSMNAKDFLEVPDIEKNNL